MMRSALGDWKRDDEQHLGAVPAETSYLVRCLAGEIQAVPLRELQVFVVDLIEIAPLTTNSISSPACETRSCVAAARRLAA